MSKRQRLFKSTDKSDNCKQSIGSLKTAPLKLEGAQFRSSIKSLMLYLPGPNCCTYRVVAFLWCHVTSVWQNLPVSMKMYSKVDTLHVHWTRTQRRGAVLRLPMDCLQLSDLSVDLKRRWRLLTKILQTAFWLYFGSIQTSNQLQLAHGDLRTASRPYIRVQCTRKVSNLLYIFIETGGILPHVSKMTSHATELKQDITDYTKHHM